MDNGEFLTLRWIFLLRAGFSYSEMIFVLRVLRDGFLYSQPKGPIFRPCGRQPLCLSYNLMKLKYVLPKFGIEILKKSIL